MILYIGKTKGEEVNTDDKNAQILSTCVHDCKSKKRAFQATPSMLQLLSCIKFFEALI